MQQRSAAQKCAVLFGVLLVAVGIVGFFYNGTYPFRSPLFKNLDFLTGLCDELGLKLAKKPTDHPGQELIEVTF